MRATLAFLTLVAAATAMPSLEHPECITGSFRCHGQIVQHCNHGEWIVNRVCAHDEFCKENDWECIPNSLSSVFGNPTPTTTCEQTKTVTETKTKTAVTTETKTKTETQTYNVTTTTTRFARPTETVIIKKIIEKDCRHWDGWNDDKKHDDHDWKDQYWGGKDCEKDGHDWWKKSDCKRHDNSTITTTVS